MSVGIRKPPPGEIRELQDKVDQLNVRHKKFMEISKSHMKELKTRKIFAKQFSQQLQMLPKVRKRMSRKNVLRDVPAQTIMLAKNEL